MLMYVWRFERVAVIMSTAPFARCFLAVLGRQDEDAAVIPPRLERKQSFFFFFYIVSSRSAEGTVSFFGGTWRRDFFFFFCRRRDDGTHIVPIFHPFLSIPLSTRSSASRQRKTA